MKKITGCVFRPCRRVNGRKVKGAYYVLRLKAGGKPAGKDIPLKVRDQQVANKMKVNAIIEKERELAGLLAPKPLRDAAQRPLPEHLADFLADLRSRGKDKHYISILEAHLLKLFGECRWQLPQDITADSFVNWRSRQSFAAKTKHHYQIDCSNFMNWMQSNRRLMENPLKFVGKVELRGNEVVQRRAFTVEEIKRLALVAGSRWVIYLTAINTGLRRKELKALRKGDVHLYESRPFIMVRASTAKNREAASLWLNEELANELKRIIAPGDSGAEPVFERFPRMPRFKKDLVEANIPYRNEHGQVADFHALRHTLATNLAMVGVHPAMTKAVMRHSDIKLTMGTYTHTSALALAEAVEKLPTYGADASNTPGNAPKIVKSSPSGSAGVLLENLHGRDEVAENISVCPPISSFVPSCPEAGMVRGAGFEPATPTVSR